MAGTTKVGAIRNGSLDGGSINPPVARIVEFTADASDGSFASGELAKVGGLIVGMGIAYGVTAPSGATVTITDEDGIVVLSGSAGRTYTEDGPIPVAGKLTVSATGNSTNSAQMTVAIYVM